MQTGKLWIIKKNVESVGHNDKVMIKMVRNGGWAGKLKALNK